MSAPQPETLSFENSMQRLKSAQKSSRGAAIYSVVINRPLGRVFAACAHQVGLKPNHVTMISGVATFSGIVAVASLEPGWLSAVVVPLALVLGYALDAADGQLARLRGGGSLTGEWLDHLIDSGKIASLHLAVLIMAYRHFTVGRWWLLVPLMFSVAYVVHFFGMLLTDLLTRINSATTGAAAAVSPPSQLMSIVKLPTDYGLLCLSFVLLAVPSAFLVVYSALALAMVGYTALVLPRWYARVRRLN